MSAKEEITRQQKISGQRPISWNSANTADSAANIRPTERQNRYSLGVSIREVMFILDQKESQAVSRHQSIITFDEPI